MAIISGITVEVVYADVDKQMIIPVTLQSGSTIENAIDRSGILMHFPQIDLMRQKVGIFSQIKKLSDEVKDGDRVEIYRPLVINPKEARKKRANSKQNPIK